MKRRFLSWVRTLVIAACVLLSLSAAQIQNPGFESGFEGWRNLWTRETGNGELVLDSSIRHSGHHSAHVIHRSGKDWSFEPASRVAVKAGEIFKLAAWMKMTESREADATLCVAAFDELGRAIDWSYGARTIADSTDWTLLRSRFVIPEGVATIQTRVIGHGKASTWIDDSTLEKTGALDFSKRRSLQPVTIRNAALEVTLNTSDATLTVIDHRIKRRFDQKPLRNQLV